MPYPPMSVPLAANPNPATFDAGPLGKLMVDGAVTGGFFYQNNPALDCTAPDTGAFLPFCATTHNGYGDIFNGQVIVNKTDGPVQAYLQAGVYSLPTLGTPYFKASKVTPMTYGYVPLGFVKLVPNSSFNIIAGSLPTLIGAELMFTYQNMNIERGLLWAQEPLVSKGVQGNYTHGPWAFSLAVTDGYYSDEYTNVSGSVTYTFKNSDTLIFGGEGNAGTYRGPSTFATPIEQANSMIYNLIYTHTQGPWTITPYIQYNRVGTIDGGATTLSGDTWGGAVLIKYNFTPEFSVSGRGEYIKSSGAGNFLGYGVDSSAWSITLTPAYQKGIFFVRGEVSYTAIDSGTPGFMFGADGLSDSQTRFVGEAGLLF
jgi:hypothetical protein